MLSETAAQLKTVVREQLAPGYTANVPIEQQREATEKGGESYEKPDNITLDETTISGVYCEWHSADTCVENRYIIHYHGGGYSNGSPNSYRALATQLALHTKAKVLVPGYRLVPEYPFPAGLDDSTAVYKGLLDQGIASENIMFTGDSAGAGMALSVVHKLRELGLPFPRAIATMSAWLDLTITADSYKTKRDSDPWLTYELCCVVAKMYVPDFDPKNPLVSPIFGDLRDFPPMLMHVGSDEIVRDDTISFAEKAKSAGVDVEVKIWDEMWHVFQFFAPACPESNDSLKEIGAFVEKHLG